MIAAALLAALLVLGGCCWQSTWHATDFNAEQFRRDDAACQIVENSSPNLGATYCNCLRSKGYY